ncbi:hypothetical protein HGI30_16710 [Paenibacillus albicereus]|uniref:Uncharacterized protein n=1 Tax=Paenibacillus albicereus TaxID=2726185 RepID=A0A6H2H075_9BACL|nr:hypothetical protein [Paenibacillus albicereus]QJC53052.1 hypothetical protein HGI30_16710 [Paenibacillus albicereus]
MYPISAVYADYLKRHDREFKVKLQVGAVTYDDTSIVDFTIDNALSLTDGLAIGTTNLSELKIKLRTQDEIPSNAMMVPYLAMDTGGLAWNQAAYPWNQAAITWAGGGTEWLPLGEFYVDSRERVNDVWVYTCYDKLVYADVPYVSGLSYPATHKAVWDEICTRLGYTYDSSVQIRAGTITAAPTGYSCRQVLGFIAAANTACLFAGKDGVLRFKRFRGGTAPVIQMTSADYVRVRQTNPVKSYTRVVLTYDTEEGNAYESGSGDENHTLYVTIPFGTQAMADQIRVDLAGFSYTPISMESRGFPHFDQGDELQFERYEGKTWLDTQTPWAATETPWDGVMRYRSIILRQVMSFKGGLKLSIEAPSVSEQQSEFKVDGALTTAINALNKSVVKQGKLYYGASLSRETGLTIDRSDGKARAVLNADELTFYRGSDKALWFDVANNKYRFSGTLEAADGVFSGSLSAATGTFRGSLQAATGTFSGDLSAAGGTFRGNLSAAGGTFSGALQAASGSFSGQITASTIQGGTITGALVRTSATGARVELDAGGWRTFDGGGTKRIGITLDTSYGMSAINWYGESGGVSGAINGQDALFQILANAPMLIQSFRGIQFGGSVDFGGVSVYGLTPDKVVGLSQQLQALWDALNNKSDKGHVHSYTVPSHNHGNAANQNFSYSGSTGSA